MSKSSIHFSNYISLAVMLLMFLALVAAQSDASDYAAEKALSVAPIKILDDRLDIDFDGHIGYQALKVSISVVTE